MGDKTGFRTYKKKRVCRKLLFIAFFGVQVPVAMQHGHPQPLGRRVVSMLTLQELKLMTEVPEVKKKAPTAKSLQDGGKRIVWRRIGCDTELSVYSNGYAVYRIGKRTACNWPGKSRGLPPAFEISSDVPVCILEIEEWNCYSAQLVSFSPVIR